MQEQDARSQAHGIVAAAQADADRQIAQARRDALVAAAAVPSSPVDALNPAGLARLPSFLRDRIVRRTSNGASQQARPAPTLVCSCVLGPHTHTPHLHLSTSNLAERQDCSLNLPALGGRAATVQLRQAVLAQPLVYCASQNGCGGGGGGKTVGGTSEDFACHEVAACCMISFI